MTKTTFKLLVIIVRSIQNGVVRFGDTHCSVCTQHSNELFQRKIQKLAQKQHYFYFYLLSPL